jgi:hypothetical protein
MNMITDFNLESCFQQLRFDPNHHLGLGDIRLTLAEQEEIVERIEQKLIKHDIMQGARVLMWLGQWRDKLPIEAIHALQDIVSAPTVANEGRGKAGI